MTDFVKKPCSNCPFRRDVRPYLTPERAREIAYAAANQYNDFPCHKTIKYDGDEDDYGRPTGDFSRAKTCAGFLTMRAQISGVEIDDFDGAYDACYESPLEMVMAYSAEWNKTHKQEHGKQKIDNEQNY